jgi:hypothetical protein
MVGALWGMDTGERMMALLVEAGARSLPVVRAALQTEGTTY